MPPKSAKLRHYSLSGQNSIEFCKDKAKAISAKLLELNVKKINGENKMKREETGRNKKTGRKKHQKLEETR